MPSFTSTSDMTMTAREELDRAIREMVDITYDALVKESNTAPTAVSTTANVVDRVNQDEFDIDIDGDFSDDCHLVGDAKTFDVDNMDLDLDLNLDVDTEVLGAEEAAVSSAGSTDSASDSTASNGPVEDVSVEYMGTCIPCDSSILMRESGYFNAALKDMDLSIDADGNLPCIHVDRFSECESSDVFYSVLDAMYSGYWSCKQTLESETSYLTWVKLWLMGQQWDVLALKQIALNGMFLQTETLKKSKDASPDNDKDKDNDNDNDAESRQRRNAHLTSFTRGVRLALRHGWHAQLWKELYQCGEDLSPALRPFHGFRAWVSKSKDARDFARAIGVKDL